MVKFVKHDLQFILDGILVSETHAEQTNDTSGGVWTVADIETSRQALLNLVPNSFEPIGMRTITGELNNLIEGQSDFGAIGEFPRLLDPDYRDDAATGNSEVPFPLGPPGSPVVTNTDYAVSDGPSNTSGSDGNVVDSDPRIISNLIVDQSVNNPAAVAAAEADPGLDGVFGSSDDILGDGVELINPDGVAGSGDEFFFIPNLAPDEGLSAPFNSWMTLFGQFFDHGLDLVNKGGSGTVFIPLQPDDPLFVPGSPTNFMVLTRATVDPGPDGLLSTDDDVSDAVNVTSPFVDQNQTYTSHPSHQIFLREYVPEGGILGNPPVATGALVEGAGGGMATWADVKAQARDLLGIELTDVEAINIPLFAVDQYGEFLRGANGLPQFVMSDGSLVEGNLATPVSVADAEAATGLTVQRTGFSFLVDIAHAANPVDSQTGLFLTRHEDGDPTDGLPPAGTYDGDLLDAHFIAGDGRANENFGLTAVHHVFHQEHNRLVEHTKQTLVTTDGSGDVPDAIALLEGYLVDPLPAGFQPVNRDDFASDAAFDAAVQAAVDSLTWDGDRLFQAAKFGTEMQYQHLVFEEFGRKVQPLIDVFASFEGTVDAKIVGEFAHTVYRFGHSMLTETVDLMDSDGNLTEAGLIKAFLNPIGFHQQVEADGSVPIGADAQDAAAAAGAIVRGMTRQQGNEIDEFVTGALRNNLLGLPLDLAAINIARGRDTGIPTLNDARAEFFAGTGDTKLKPYESWFDFALHLKHEESIINFIASYGQHSTITSATTLADKRAAALDIVVGGPGAPADRLDFLNSTGAWETQESGLNLVDFWIGGLAEAIEPFGGMLGSTFNFVFEDQMERLQDGDRFYYLGRTAGLNFVTQLEQNSFAGMIIRNTDIGDNGGDHLPGDIFSTPNFILEVDPSLQVTNLAADGVTELPGGNGDPVGDSILIPLVIRDNPSTGLVESNYLHYTGGEHVVLGGTDDADTIIGGIGDDTIWGDDGDDDLEGGDGADIIIGGSGDDIITDIGGEDNLQGLDGNDAIFSGAGEDLILAGDGKDFVLMGPDLGETFGGLGDDFIKAGTDENIIFGGEGNDWLEGNGSNNLVQGDNGDPFLNSTITGHDVFIPGLGDDDYDAESGDDVMVGGIGIQRFEGVNGFDWATYFNDVSGVEADFFLRAFDETPIPPSPQTIQDRFDQVEGLSGSAHADILRGGDADELILRTLNNGGDHVLRNFDLIQGLREGDFGGDFDGTALFDSTVTEWAEGDIILGGDGSDVIEGRGGNDIIDGDLALGVRLLIRDPGTGDAIATADHMQGELFDVDPGTGTPLLDGNDERIPTSVGGFETLHEAVFARAINPGDIHIVREIIDQGGINFDTAVFSGNLSDYTVEGSGTANGFADTDGDGFVSVTDNAGGDGSDLLRNIERLQFADQSLAIPGLNIAPIGLLAIADATSGTPDSTPQVGQELRATLGTVVDGDGINSPLDFVWQFEEEPGSGAFVDIPIITPAGEEGVARGEFFTVTEDLVGLALRVRGTYVDSNQVIESVVSAPTALVAVDPGIPSIDGTPGPDTLNGTPLADLINGLGGDDTIRGFAGDDILNGDGGNDLLIGGTGDDTLNGGLDNDDVRGNAGNDILNGGDGTDILRGGADDDTLNGDAGDDDLRGNAGNDTANGGDGLDTLRGGTGNDILNGDGDDDTLIGGGGDDDLTGGAGNDVVNGNGGDDTIFWIAGDGRDIIDGGGGDDRLRIEGSADDETFFIETRADYLTRKGGAAETLAAGTDIVVSRTTGVPGTDTVITELNRVDDIDVNGRGGNDTFIVSGDFAGTDLDPSTITITGSGDDDTVDISDLRSQHRVVFNSNGGNDTIIGELRPQDSVQIPDGATMTDNGDGTTSISDGNGNGGGNNGSNNSGDLALDITASDIAELLNLVRGLPSDNLEDPNATGIRDLEGTGNNQANPDFGSADQTFIRLTNAYYGDPVTTDDGKGNRDVNPIHNGLDPRDISNILGSQEADLPKADKANIFFNAFGQYFDHGLDFLPKGGSGTLPIGGGNDDPADLTRGEVDHVDTDGIPQHLNRTSPFVDQNQAYGSTELVGTFLREGDDNGGLTGRLFAGSPDPVNPEFNLLPTLGQLVRHHWDNNTIFDDVELNGGPKSFQEIFPGLVDTAGNIDQTILADLSNNFMGTGHAILLDTNPFISLEDHLVAGDGRANENYTLTSIHTIWARNHNFHVDQLTQKGFNGTAEELFQAAKIINEAEYQRVVFDEYLDALLGGMPGSGEHSFDDYNPGVDARISHEFAAAAFRFGHSMLAETVTVLDENGQPQDVRLFNAFLNPTNDPDAFTQPLPPGFTPQPGMSELGVAPIVGGIVTQAAEETDFNIVDAVRNDLVRINADLFSFNVARGWDIGLGTLNQVRMDLMASTDPYVMEAVDRAGDLTPYDSWEDFQDRNGLSDTVIAQFKQAYPDLVLQPDEIADFKKYNPNIDLVDGNTVKGIDRVDLWVGGLAEEHIRGGVVGQTFWAVLFEQFDRLQEGDRFYYLNRVEEFDFYDTVENQSFADIIARNTGLTDLPDDIFRTTDDIPVIGQPGDTTGDGTNDDNNTGDNNDDDMPGDGNGDDQGQGDDEGQGDDQGQGNDQGGDTSSGNDDIVSGGDGDDNVYGGEGDDEVYGNDGNDNVFGNGGNDIVDGGAGNDNVYGDGYIPTPYDPFTDVGWDSHGNWGCQGGWGDHHHRHKEGFEGDSHSSNHGGDTYGGKHVNYHSNDAGMNFFYGATGDDTVTGGPGSDKLYGGPGADVFVYSPGDGHDAIMDFEKNKDSIRLEHENAEFTVSYFRGGVALDFGNGDVLEVHNAKQKGCNYCPTRPYDDGDIWG